jgi:hypothetical protein
MPTLPPHRLALHPAVWCLPVMALLAWAAMSVNGGFYEFAVNYDPQGDAQQQEWQNYTRLFRYTSGMVVGQLLAVLVGVALSHWHRQVIALVLAIPLGALLALVSVGAAHPLAAMQQTGRFAASPYHDPVLLPVLLRELAAYPLVAVAGVGLGILLRGRRVLPAVLLLGWCVATLTGLFQTGTNHAWPWLLWTVPPVAAGTALALAGTSLNEESVPPVLLGDWGHRASIALLVGAAAWAVALNLLALRQSAGRASHRLTAHQPSSPGNDEGPGRGNHL